MAGGIELPLSDCRACGIAAVAPWEFAPDDVHCGQCGKHVLRLGFWGEVPIVTRSGQRRREVWLYAGPDSSPKFLVWGVHGAPGRLRSAIAPDLDFAAGSARFDVPGLPPLEFDFKVLTNPADPAGLDNPDPHPADDTAYRRQRPRRAAVIVELVPRAGEVPYARLPVAGATGWLTLVGPYGERKPARLLPQPDPLLDVGPAAADDGTLPELVGYLDAGGEAEVQLEVTARGRAVFQELYPVGPPTAYRKAWCRAPASGYEYPLDRPVRQTVRFEAGSSAAQGETLTLKIFLTAVAKPVEYRCRFTLSPKPHLVIRPNGAPPDEVTVGGRPVEFQLLLEPAVGPGTTTPELTRPPEVTYDPPDCGDWFRVEPFQTPLPLEGPYRIRVTLDGGRLDRAASAGRQLAATVRFEDQAGTTWDYTLRVRAVRPDRDDGVLALDWGTTNTCAAHATDPGEPPRPLALPPPALRADPPDYEQFPSVVYVEDVSDPARPVFHIGPEAQNRAALHPECLIHSLKRRFLVGLPVYVRDEAGREHGYPVDELARLVLVRLVEMAEQELGREVGRIGFTFPTKWPAAARRRFEAVLRRVADDLTAVRPRGVEVVELAPPDIDEANAVALNVIRDLVADEKLEPGRPYNLVAYDFGGGTIDTSVLRVVYDPGAEQQLVTRYLGIGGRGDFGGDEVTRATVLLLRDRINGVLAGNDRLATDVRYELPVRRGGDPPPPPRPGDDIQQGLAALKNWEFLRLMAEEVKRALCRSDAAAADEPVREALQSRLSDLRCYPASGDPSAGPRTLEQLVEDAFGIDRQPFFDAVRFGLKDVADYEIAPAAGGAKFTVRGRVRDTFEEVRKQLEDAGGAAADLIVLAGGGCRLPLVPELVRECLGPPGGKGWDPKDRLIYKETFAKQRVAYGKAAYLALSRHNDQLSGGLARSVDVLHRPLVVIGGELFKPRQDVVVRVGEPVHAPDRWHPFTLSRGHVKTEAGRRALWLSVLIWRDGKRPPSQLGYFDLDAPVAAEGAAAAPVPELKTPVSAELRLTRSPAAGGPGVVRLDLRVRAADGTVLGHYPFVPRGAAGEIDEKLQGELG